MANVVRATTLKTKCTKKKKKICLPGATAIPQPAHLKFCWAITVFLLNTNNIFFINTLPSF